ncbi:MAG: dicarboxylate/amino acid:cation symporter [Sphingomonadaceae bacterium]|nr:dicarboxylate/amino acid:cation symporter [Sphingomonadaceae bacterium]
MAGDESAKAGGAAFSLPEIKVPALPAFAGLAAGIALGLLLGGTQMEQPALSVTGPVGALWLKALKMTILPLVAGLLFTGIVQSIAAARAGAMARSTITLIAMALTASAVIGLLATPLLLELFPVPAQAAQALASGLASEAGRAPGAADFLSGLIPENIFHAAAEGAMLPFIVFLVFFAVASTRLAQPHRRQLAVFFEALAGAMMVIIGWVLALAPVGVLALAFGLAVRSGTAAIETLFHYIAVVSANGVMVLIGAYIVGTVAARRSPLRFARAMLPAQAVAISTQSSLASLPAMVASCRKLALRDGSSEFVLPLAVALFRATSPAMNLAVAYYVARLAGVDPSPTAMIAAGAVAVLASLSTVSLPGTISFIASIGPIALAMGVPIEPLALLVAVEMLPDIVRTVGNVTMNVAITAVVERKQKPGPPDQQSDQK